MHISLYMLFMFTRTWLTLYSLDNFLWLVSHAA